MSAVPTLHPSRPVSPATVSPSGPRAIAIEARSLVKTYGSARNRVIALDGVDLDVRSGEFTAIMGPSGSGKSTLMHCLAGLDSPTSGAVFYGDDDLTRMGDRELSALRAARVGFVFQSFNLLPTLTGRQNVLLPLDLSGRTVEPGWLEELTAQLGIGDRLDRRPSELSGGEQQRVAIARALVGRPDVVFADEPTGALDSRTSAAILSLLRGATRETGQTVVMVTHDPDAAAYADRVVHLTDGSLVGDERSQPSGTTLAAGTPR